MTPLDAVVIFGLITLARIAHHAGRAAGALRAIAAALQAEVGMHELDREQRDKLAEQLHPVRPPVRPPA